MKLLILEYVTAGGLGDPCLSPLLEEADAMALALARDFSELSEYTVSLIRHPRLAAPSPSFSVIPSTGLVSEWENAITQHDHILLVAPETDSILLKWSTRADQLSTLRLGPTQEALRMTSDKWFTEAALSQHCIPCVSSYRPDTIIPWSDHGDAWVLKPRDRCGCEGVQRFARGDAGKQALLQQAMQNPDHWMIQPWMPGQAASLTILGSYEGAQLLSVNQQHLQFDSEGFVTLEKVTTGAIDASPERFTALVDSIHASVPGLLGIYGVDILITPNALTVVEINPRVTSAYPDLYAVLGINPAQLWLNSLS